MVKSNFFIFRKIVVLLFLVIISFGNVSAQELKDGTNNSNTNESITSDASSGFWRAKNTLLTLLTYGIKFGANFNNFAQSGTNFGGNLGGFVNLPIKDAMVVQAELLYDMQGGGLHQFIENQDERTTNSTTGDEVTYVNRELTYHTISLPISFQYLFDTDGDINPYLSAGGSIDFIFKSQEKRDLIHKLDGVVEGILTNKTEDFGNIVNPLQFGIHAGAGFKFKLSGGNQSGIELRWRQALNDTNGKSNVIDLNESDARIRYSVLYSSTISINFFYSF